MEISRSQDEFEQAYKAFQQAQLKFKGFRGICEDESNKLRKSADVKLDRAYAILEQNGQKSAVLAVENATKRVDHHVSKVRSARILLLLPFDATSVGEIRRTKEERDCLQQQIRGREVLLHGAGRDGAL